MSLSLDVIEQQIDRLDNEARHENILGLECKERATRHFVVRDALRVCREALYVEKVRLQQGAKQ